LYNLELIIIRSEYAPTGWAARIENNNYEIKAEVVAGMDGFSFLPGIWNIFRLAEPE
jgi:hypothetical protein